MEKKFRASSGVFQKMPKVYPSVGTRGFNDDDDKWTKNGNQDETFEDKSTIKKKLKNIKQLHM